MSLIGTVETISEELEKKIFKELIVKKKMKTYGPHGMKIKYEEIRPYRNYNNQLFLPFDWALRHTPLKRKEKEEYQTMTSQFTGKLTDAQKEVKSECIQRLNQFNSVLLSLHVGFGKTILAIYLATKIGLQTLIITHRNVLYDQWKESIEAFTNSNSVSIVKSCIKEKTDFTIISPENLKKHDYLQFQSYGLVIVDELHCILAEKLSECLLRITPRFLIGLSATPTRPDGLDSLIDLYFGIENKISRELYHAHVVYKIETEYTYEASAKDWNNLLNFQCFNDERNRLIVNIALHHPDRNFLILSKRKEQADILYAYLLEKKQTVALLTGSTNTYDENARIIIATYSKCSTGFSCKKLDTLILASDVISDATQDYMVQVAGRIFRSKDVSPMIFDIVDANPIFHKHFNCRKKCYIKHGGIVKKKTSDSYFNHTTVEP